MANEEYLVRGGRLKCDKGSHTRAINLPTCHGVYVNQCPMLHEEDCTVGENGNITMFGICNSGENPNQDKQVEIEAEDGSGPITGFQCTPQIIGQWKKSAPKTKIVQNGCGVDSEGDYKNAVTTDSFLVCAYGGLIEPITSGQNNNQ